jgi:hypothetical protein
MSSHEARMGYPLGFIGSYNGRKLALLNLAVSGLQSAEVCFHRECITILFTTVYESTHRSLVPITFIIRTIHWVSELALRNHAIPGKHNRNLGNGIGHSENRTRNTFIQFIRSPPSGKCFSTYQNRLLRIRWVISHWRGKIVYYSRVSFSCMFLVIHIVNNIFHPNLHV